MTSETLEDLRRERDDAQERIAQLEAEVERLRNGEIFTERQFRALEKAGWRLEEKGYPNVLFGGVMPGALSGVTVGGYPRKKEGGGRESGAKLSDGKTQETNSGAPRLTPAAAVPAAPSSVSPSPPDFYDGCPECPGHRFESSRSPDEERGMESGGSGTNRAPKAAADSAARKERGPASQGGQDAKRGA